MVAGGSFCAALLQSGRVVLWGQPRGGGEATEGEALELPHMRARKQVRRVAMQEGAPICGTM